MGKITEDLLRKRAEHNEGILSTLEEISLHQFDIEKIENIDKYCRHLKILYLQSNIIEKLENLDKLKELDYLNIAVNNISMIEGLEGCESLRKLDMTLNFIDLEDFEQSIKNLTKNPMLREILFTGNPCADWKGHREYIIHMLPQITFIDGKEVLKSERILAAQNFAFLQEELRKLAKENPIKKANDPDRDNPNKYSKEYRRKMYKELEEEKLKKEEEKNRTRHGEVEEKPKPPSVYKDNGEIRICNQGKYEFLLDEDIFKTGIMTFELKLPKFLDTTKLDVDLQPWYVRVDVKGKITQLKFSYEIVPSKASVQKSQTTGYLVIKAPLLDYEKKWKGLLDKTSITNVRVGEDKKEKEKNKSAKNKLVVNNIEMVESVNSELEKKIKLEKRGMIEETKESPDKIKKEENFKSEDIDLSELPELD